LSRLNISARYFPYRRRDQSVYIGFRHTVSPHRAAPTPFEDFWQGATPLGLPGANFTRPKWDKWATESALAKPIA
jgi:hypothetical protein